MTVVTPLRHNNVMPFVKLDCGIIHSSLWAEDSDTKICWITLLLLADATGFVRAAASAIAREAGIPADVARRALDLFLSPDDESRTPDNEGKRVERVEGGYRVLNYEKYRERDYTNAERQKRWRETQKSNVTGVTEVLPVTPRNTCRSRKQKHTQKEGANGSRPQSKEISSATILRGTQWEKKPQSVEDWLKELESDKTYQGIDVRREYGKMLAWCNVRRKQPTKRRFINWINGAEKTLPARHAAKPDYKRNYSPPAREPTEAELENARRIAHEETARFKEAQRNG